MVKVKESQGFDRFEGTVEDIKVEPTEYKDKDGNTITGTQYHMYIKPTNIEVKGKTGQMHEWIRVPQTATEEEVPEGSVLHRYLTELWTVMPELKKKDTIPETFLELKGKKFLFVKKVLGKAFEGNAAKEYWTPMAKL